jgi:hypothetical protein
MKIAMPPEGTKPATFGLVAQYLNQLRHRFNENKISRKSITHVVSERCFVEFSLKADRNRPLKDGCMYSTLGIILKPEKEYCSPLDSSLPSYSYSGIPSLEPRFVCPGYVFSLFYSRQMP